MRIFLESYGCTLNRGEGIELAEILTDKGHTITQTLAEGEEADLIIINTCTVIETTERKMLKRIKELSAKGGRVLVCGCLGAVGESEILRISPEILIFPPDSNDEILHCVEGLAPHSTDIHETHPTRSLEDRIGILPIATGCLGNCSYCITRFARGSLKSRPLPDIQKRAADLIAAGMVEIQVTAQDTAVYGLETTGGPTLPDVLDTITSLEGDFMVRVGMMNPGATMKIIDRLAGSYDSPKIFNFIHLPVQSGSDEVLEAMDRQYKSEDFRAIIQRLRARHPDITISTDIITGFPGETEEEFQDSIEIIKETKPDIVNVTRFSPRSGTKAIELRNQVPTWMSKERSRMMTELRFQIVREKAEDMVGQQIRAMATEYRKPGTTFLRTPNYRPVVVDGTLPLGTWNNINVNGHTPTHLTGKIA